MPGPYPQTLDLPLKQAKEKATNTPAYFRLNVGDGANNF